jgi:small subunit ribosomal protein S4
VYRAGFASTRRQARQMVVHGHFLVNGKKVNIPSYRVTPYDIIDVAPKSLNLDSVHHRPRDHHERVVPAWLTARPNRMRILVHQLPTREQIVIDVAEQLIVELYSK